MLSKSLFLSFSDVVGFNVEPTLYTSYGIFFSFTYWWRKTSVALLYIILGTNGHLSRTIDIPLASWIAFSYEEFKDAGVDLLSLLDCARKTPCILDQIYRDRMGKEKKYFFNWIKNHT
jgi:hypothetical protein